MCSFLRNSLRTVGLGILDSQLVRFKDALVFPINIGVCVHCTFIICRADPARVWESVTLTDRKNNAGGFFAPATYSRLFVVKINLRNLFNYFVRKVFFTSLLIPFP